MPPDGHDVNPKCAANLRQNLPVDRSDCGAMKRADYLSDAFPEPGVVVGGDGARSVPGLGSADFSLSAFGPSTVVLLVIV